MRRVRAAATASILLLVAFSAPAGAQTTGASGNCSYQNDFATVNNLIP